MAQREMTFAVPQNIAEQFVKRPQLEKRMGYIWGKCIADKLKKRDRQLVRACEPASKDPDILAIEREMDVLTTWR
jgi:hypothetical protein